MRDSNPQPTAFGCCSPFEPTLSQPARAGIGIRHGSAARTGRDTSPHRCCRWIRLRVAACFEAAIHGVASRRGLHRGTQAPRRRRAQARTVASPRPLPRASMARVPRDRAMHACSKKSFANARTKMPPAWSPRAFAVPRKIGVTDLPWRSRSGQEDAFMREPRAQPCIALARRWHGAVGDVVAEGHGRSLKRWNGSHGSRRVRTLLASICSCKQFFDRATNGRLADLTGRWCKRVWTPTP